MKRIYIALFFIILSFTAAAIQTGYLNAKADMFNSYIHKTDKLIEQEDFLEAINLCKETERKWEDSTKIINLLLSHQYTDNIGIEISQMRTAAENKNISLYLEKSTSVKQELKSIKNGELPLAENIL